MAADRLPVLTFALPNMVFVTLLIVRPSFAGIRAAYNFNTLLIPCLFILWAVIRLGQWRWHRGNWQALRAAVICIVIAALALGLRLYATHIEPYRLVVREVSIESEKVSRPLRILHITDIQSAGVGSYERKAFARMRELKPDLIVHTGDLLQLLPPATFESELPKIAALFRTLTPRLGVYGVIGDVDRITEGIPTQDLGGLKILSDEEAVVECDGTRVRILGISRQASGGNANGTTDIKNWFTETQPSDFTILLGHSPDYIMSIQDVPIDLCLAGHTHGGQIRIPFVGPLVTLSDVPRAWARGFREVNRTRLNVSAGIGSEHKDRVPPIRLACPPEMTLITIVPKVAFVEKSTRLTQMPGNGIVAFFVKNLPPWKAIIMGGPIGILWAYGCLYFAGCMKRRKRMKTGYTRKIFHFLIFMSVAAIHLIWGAPIVCLFGGMTTLVIFYAVFRGPGHLLYEAMAREKDEPHRTYYIVVPYFATLIGGLTSNILFGDVALIGYLITGLGDAIGEPVGTRFGKHQYKVPSFRGVKAVRSYEGSAAVFVVSLLAIIAGTVMSPALELPASSFLAVPLLAFLCMILEAVSPHGWDNAVLQIVPSFLVALSIGGA